MLHQKEIKLFFVFFLSNRLKGLWSFYFGVVWISLATFPGRSQKANNPAAPVLFGFLIISLTSVKKYGSGAIS